MAEAQDVDTLKRRGRRRLVGAVALVLLAVIVLPMLFDPEPRAPAPPVSVRIPGEDESSFAPKLASKAPPAKKKDAAAAPAVVEKKPEPAAEPPQPEAKAEEPKPKPEAKAVDTERARAEAALADARYIVPVGAFADPKPVTARLAAAKLPYYTEAVPTAKGPVTRVRAGPFASRDAAEQAAQKLKGLGFKPGNVAAKSG
jgi:DedD protein